jgi:hypothetical protein
MDKRKKINSEIKNEELWTRKDGQKVPVESMNEYHAKNALRKMLRENRKLQSKLRNKENARKAIVSFIKDIQKELNPFKND